MQNAMVSKSPRTPGPRNIGIVAFDGVEILDLTGPLDVLAMTSLGMRQSGVSTEDVYKVSVFAKKPGLIRTSCGLSIYADRAYGEVRDDIDTLFIPGSPDVGAVLADPVLCEWVRAMSGRVRRLVSVCTGAFLLAEAGLLNGRRATTHWAFCQRLADDYPAIQVEADRVYLRDGSMLTSGGVTSGIDLSLALIEEDWGREAALFTARFLVVFLRRPGGQSQFSGYLLSESTSRPDLRALQLWIIENPGEDLRNEALAERMAMSPRNFTRVFQQETGMTPARFVEKARLDAARHFLGTTDHRIETVAQLVGFVDPERMRRAFIRHIGISALQYRERFGPPSQQPTPKMTERDAQSIAAALKNF